MFFCLIQKLTAQNSSVIGVPLPSICQKTKKGDFGAGEEMKKIFNLLIIRWIQTCKISLENTQKKHLSVS
jgi:hypothetical protein